MPKESPCNYRYLIYQTQESEPPNPKRYQRWARSTHARIKDWLPRDHSAPILDLGCGVGYLLYLFEKLGYSDITGVDLSSTRVEMAGRMVPRARILEEDARKVLADNPERFALITAFDVLEHFPKNDVLPFLSLVAKALRAGGRVIFQTPNGESPWVGTVGYGDFTHEWLFTPESLAQLLKNVGLTDFAARECGPQAHGLKSFTRLLLWQFLRALMLFWNLAETGLKGSGIFTRVFLATAMKL